MQRRSNYPEDYRAVCSFPVVDTSTIPEGEPVNSKAYKLATTEELFNDYWDNTTVYSVGQLTIWQNYLWKCKVSCQNQKPAEGSTYWEKTTLEDEIPKVHTIYTRISYTTDATSPTIPVKVATVQIPANCAYSVGARGIYNNSQVTYIGIGTDRNEENNRYREVQACYINPTSTADLGYVNFPEVNLTRITGDSPVTLAIYAAGATANKSNDVEIQGFYIQL